MLVSKWVYELDVGVVLMFSEYKLVKMIGWVMEEIVVGDLMIDLDEIDKD